MLRPLLGSYARFAMCWVVCIALVSCGGGGSSSGDSPVAASSSGSASATTSAGATASSGSAADGQTAGTATTGTPATSGSAATSAGDSTVVAAQAPAPTLKSKQVTVPVTLDAAPFDGSQQLQLQVPDGFGVRVIARIPTARFMLVLPDASFLVSQPSTGKIERVVLDAAGSTTVTDFASGLNQPQDMVLAQVAGQNWLYVSESDRVTRALYSTGDLAIGALQPVVSDLPSASTPELRGAYAHELKNIAIASDGTLYISIASSCNACDSDAQATPVRGSIYRYDADGSNGRLFASGIRNAEGLGFIPGTNRLWIAANNRDDIAYPYHNDFDGDGSDDFDKVIPAYVNEQPPEPFTEVLDGGNYGWPYCNPVTNATLSNFQFVQDADLNADGAKLDCSTVAPIVRGFHAHSAPLGMSFLQDSNLPASISGGAAVALHGCWNCTEAFGYKVALVRFDADQNPLDVVDLVTGFASSGAGVNSWGRPVDVVAYPSHGSLLISDDSAGAIYEVYPTP